MRAQPSHLVAGLQGGYVPNLIEHYDTKGLAIEALGEFLDRANWDGHMKTRGSVRSGYVELGLGSGPAGPEFHEHVYVEPCPDPDECEVAEEVPA